MAAAMGAYGIPGAGARQPWIHSGFVDGAFILAPGLLATVVSLALISAGHGNASVSLWMWGVLIVGIDVAHVYSTIYRTYLDPVERSRLSSWLILLPLAAWAGGVLVYSWSAAAFWTLLAYTAVFHFIRQQYGFMTIYRRDERRKIALESRPSGEIGHRHAVQIAALRAVERVVVAMGVEPEHE